MNLEEKIIRDIKTSMLSKDILKLEVCRAIKSAIILAKSEKGFVSIDNKKEVEILQKLYKQRREAYEIYLSQKRIDLAEHEDAQSKIIATYLPKQYSLEELEILINDVMRENDLNTKKDMGRLMSIIIQRVKGRADGKTISSMLSKLLN